MGAQTSQLNNQSNDLLIKEFNWIPSLGENEISDFTDQVDNMKLYIDHRDKVSDIEQDDDLSLQVVKLVCSSISIELLNLNKLEPFKPSYNYLYFYLSKYYGLTTRHSFNEIESVINKFGLISKNDYDNNSLTNQVNDEIFNKAYPYRHIKFVYINNKYIKNCLVNGKCVLMGMGVYSNFKETKNISTLKQPDDNDEIIGGFSGLIVGFIEKDRKYIVMTVKGKQWGDNGFIFIPYDILNNYTKELCYINILEDMIKLELDISKKNKVNNYQNIVF